jgi:MFS family permease
MKSRFATKDFVILTQANFISEVGSVIYSITIGFWILSQTNSTFLMGLSSATVYIPKIIFGFYAGKIIDSVNQKFILVFTDLIAGIIIALLIIPAIEGQLSAWMVITVGFLIGITNTFAQPTARIVLPKIIRDKKYLTQANAMYSSAFTLSNIIGRAITGFLYNTLGVVFIFFIDSVSYFYSAVSESFIKNTPVKKVESEKQPPQYANLKLLKSVPGLLSVFLIIACLNFFGIMTFTLYVPFFEQDPKLSIELYGLIMAISTIGTVLGQFVLSIKNIDSKNYLKVFSISGVISNIPIIFFPLTNNIVLLGGLIFTSGITSVGINVVLNTVLQKSIPENIQGRVFALVGMVGGLLMPAGIVLAGLLAEFILSKYLISLSAIILVLVFGITYYNKSIKLFFNMEN